MDLARLQAQYDADADAYGVWWAPVLRDLGRRLVQGIPSTALSAARVVLDVGCGTGTLLSELAAVAPHATVLGIDASWGMLAAGGREVPAVQGDARRLPVTDASVDVVTSAFMLQHVDDPAAVFAEWARVLRPFGTLALAAWVGLDEWPALDVMLEELDRAGAPVVASTRQSSDQVDTVDKLSRLANDAGLRPVRVDVRPLDWHPTAEETLGQLTTMRTTGARFRALDPQRQAAVQAAARARLDDVELASTEDVCWLYAAR